MGRVDLAEDTRLGRRVALKRMGGPADPRGLARLRREAMAGASLSHVNLVSIYDVVMSDDGHLVVVMEYIAGGTLREELNRRHKLPPGDALRVLAGVAGGLDAIHDRGIVHRDVKPSNILLGEDGAVKVADLGIAAVPDRTRITTSGTVFGSLSYMAPEQLDATPSTPAIDVYALSAVAYEVLSGEKARRETNPVTLAHAIATQSPPDLRNAWHQAPASAADLLIKGMARDPRERPSSAGELVRRLRAALASEVTTSVLNSGLAAGGPERVPQRARVAPASDPPPVPQRARVAAASAPRPRQLPAGKRATRPSDPAANRQTSRSGPSESQASSRRPSEGAAGLAAAAENKADRAPGSNSGRGIDRGRQQARVGLAGGGRSSHHSSSPRRLAVAGVLALVAVGVALAIILNSSGSGSRAQTQATSSARGARTTTTRHAHNSRTTPQSSGSSGGQTASSAASTKTSVATSSAAAPATTPTSSSASPPAATSSTSPASATAPATTTPPAAASPVRAVKAFYGAAVSHDYGGAWALADPTLRSQLEGYQSFAAGQAGDRSITFDSAKVIRQSSSGATVAVQTTSVRDDGTKHCAGTVDLVPTGGGQWHLHLLHINCA
jgi:eukaryotic-like serine/threonine-protein kinase